MNRMILITSAAYVGQDLAVEVGLLPPSFLPVGNQRLFSYQLELLASAHGDIYLSIPESYQLEAFDERSLDRKGVSVLRVPENLSLGSSVLYCWNAAGKSYSGLTILHGDTLFSQIDLTADDVVSLHPNEGLYQRAAASPKDVLTGKFREVWAGEAEIVVSGYFAFSSPHLLMKGIVEAHGSFTDGLRFYASNHLLEGIHVGQWLDFGHINSFFKSRTAITTQRAFNEMNITPRLVTKSSSNTLKINGEANWFDAIPSPLRIHTPTLLCKPEPGPKDMASYELEYLYLLPLSELFVYGALARSALSHIFKAVKIVLADFAQFRPHAISDFSCFDNLYLPKTITRLKQYASQRGVDLNQPLSMFSEEPSASLMEIAAESARLISPASQSCIAINHGDLCFSNILFDSRSNSVKVIDPRGVDDKGNLTIYGDRRYDLAKLYHSAVGLYDFLIAGRYDLIRSRDGHPTDICFALPERITDAEQLFFEIFFDDGQFDEVEIQAITVHLFLSMLPLHYDRPDRQDAMVANALRLHRKLTRNFAKQQARMTQ
jgi:hypothetical protein